jgi:hypothetical protein
MSTTNNPPPVTGHSQRSSPALSVFDPRPGAPTHNRSGSHYARGARRTSGTLSGESRRMLSATKIAIATVTQSSHHSP